MKRSRRSRPPEPQASGETLFELPPSRPPEPKTLALDRPLWTEHKARLIARYLYYFVLVTKHGTYLDGFAGPQERDQPDLWAAKLVLENEPRWITHFHLFESGRESIARLEALRQAHLDGKREIIVHPGDFNQEIRTFLAGEPIRPKEATFCLLDQRTFECDWASLEVLARYKRRGPKIELFYFLPNHWLDRALANQRNLERLRAWWGRDDWSVLRGLSPDRRADLVRQRFREELGYSSVKAWPIYQRPDGGGAVMYFMIHATDHPAAPTLMNRAYRSVLQPPEPIEQLALELGLDVPSSP